MPIIPSYDDHLPLDLKTLMDGQETAMKHHDTSSGFPIRDQQVPGAKISVHSEGPTGEPGLLQLSVSPLPSGVYPNLSRMKLHAFASTFEDVAWCLSHCREKMGQLGLSFLSLHFQGLKNEHWLNILGSCSC